MKNDWLGRAPRRLFPKSSSEAIPSYSQQVLEASDSVIVRSEDELRNAITNVAISEHVTVQTDAGSTAYASGALIVVAAPIYMSGPITIPAECSGIQIVCHGMCPIYFPEWVTDCISVDANLVRMENVVTLTSDPGLGSVNCIRFGGVSYFWASGCSFNSSVNSVVGSLSFGRFSDCGMENVNCRLPKCSFTGCTFRDVSINDSVGPKLSSCDISNLTLTGTTKLALFSACDITTWDDSLSDGPNCASACSIGPGALVATGTKIVDGNI